MNCVDFQDVLPEVIDGRRDAEQEAHLRSCPACSSLVSDLNAISQVSHTLREAEEPSPRVWNSIEIALRQEGLIRQPQREPFLVPARPRRFSLAWLVPVAAAVLLVFGIANYQRGKQVARQTPAVPGTVSGQQLNGAAVEEPPDDQQLLAAVESDTPAMRAAYAADLRNVNDYIRDAEESAKSYPDDEDAQQYLMAAYEQKAMVYQMAMDRSLP